VGISWPLAAPPDAAEAQPSGAAVLVRPCAGVVQPPSVEAAAQPSSAAGPRPLAVGAVEPRGPSAAVAALPRAPAAAAALAELRAAIGVSGQQQQPVSTARRRWAAAPRPLASRQHPAGPSAPPAPLVQARKRRVSAIQVELREPSRQRQAWRR